MFSKDQLYWEELAQIDPYWAILSERKYRYGKWDPDEFFQSGDEQIFHSMNHASGHGFPAGRDLALDFGCGIGRLTRALSKIFSQRSWC